MEYSKTKLPFVSGRKYNNLLKNYEDVVYKLEVLLVQATGNMLYDVVITRTEGMKFYQSMYICNSRIYAFTDDKRFSDNKKSYETWIKECINGTKFDYTIKVFSDLDEYIKKVNSVSAANDKIVKIDKHIVERILVTCV